MNSDRGAIGVMVVLLLVPLLVATALVVDVGAVYVKRRELQNAADAAALAIAQDCGRGSCGNITTTAHTLSVANTDPGVVSAPVINGNSVSVDTTSVVNYSFAPAIGIDNATVAARSTATWGSPSGGRAILPIAFSWCSFSAQTGGGVPSLNVATTIYLPKTDLTTCAGPSGNLVPGGFAWLNADSTGCTATSSTFVGRTYSDPGRSVPSVCSAADFTAQQGKTVLLPVFDTFGNSGSGAWYHIYAYAAFQITGYSFGGQYKWNAPCSGSDSCIRGYFTVFVEASDAFTYTAGTPDLGGRIVALTT